MGYVIELYSGEWLRSPAEKVVGTDELTEAAVFVSIDAARAWCTQHGVQRYDVWMADGETWKFSQLAEPLKVD